MRYLIDNYFESEQIDSLNMHLFALAAYNCGPGNVRKLRREAKEQGLNENVWFNNVEIMAARSYWEGNGSVCEQYLQVLLVLPGASTF